MRIAPTVAADANATAQVTPSAVELPNTRCSMWFEQVTAAPAKLSVVCPLKKLRYGLRPSQSSRVGSMLVPQLRA